MHAFGGSVQVAAAGDILKIHVHTDTPEAVFTYAAVGAGWRGPRPTTCGRSTGAWPTRDRRPVAVVTDSSADLAGRACSTGTTSRWSRCR